MSNVRLSRRRIVLAFIGCYALWLTGYYAVVHSRLPHGIQCAQWVQGSCNNYCQPEFGHYPEVWSYVLNPVGYYTTCDQGCRMLSGTAQAPDTTRCVRKIWE